MPTSVGAMTSGRFGLTTKGAAVSRISVENGVKNIISFMDEFRGYGSEDLESADVARLEVLLQGIWDDGAFEGFENGHVEGHSEGYDDGHDEGYEEGREDATAFKDE
jgi:hypothetical protein